MRSLLRLSAAGLLGLSSLTAETRWTRMTSPNFEMCTTAGALSKIEADLTGYLRGGRFQGVLLSAKIEKITGDLKAEPAGEFDVKLILAEIGDRRTKARSRSGSTIHRSWRSTAPAR